MEQISNLGISSLVDALLLLRYVPKGAEIGRLLVVVKSRGMAHSNKHHEFKITDQGIVLLGPFAEGGHPGSEGGEQGTPAFHPRTWES